MDLQQFGASIKAKYPAYKDYSDEEIGKRMLEKYPVYKDRVKMPSEKKTIQGLGQNLLKNLRETGEGIVDTGKYIAGQKMRGKGDVELLGDLAIASGRGLFEEGKEFIKSPVDYAYKNPADIALAAFPAAKVGSKVAKLTGKAGGAVRHPKKTVGRMLETRAAQSGEVPSELIKKHIKSENLLDRVTTASSKDRRLFEEKVKEEIKGLIPQFKGKSTDVALSEARPRFSDILKYRTSAGARGYPGKGVARSPENIYYKNLQRAYSEILKEGARTENLDRAYSLLSKIEGVGKAALPYGVGGAVGFIGLQYLLNKLLKN